MAKSAAIFSLQIGVHNTEGGSLDSNQLPDVANDAVSFQGMAVTDAIIDAFAFEELSHSQEGMSRATPGQQALAPVALRNTSGGAKFGVANGDFFRVGYPDATAATFRLRGANGQTPANEPWGKWIGSSMGLHSPANSTVKAGFDGAADGSTFIVDRTDPEVADLKIGAPVRIKKLNSLVHEYAIITDTVDDGVSNVTVKVFPSFSFQVTDGYDVTLCYAYFPVIGRGNAANNDFALRFAMGATGSQASVQTLSVGNRCTAIEITNDGGATIMTLTAKPLAAVSEDDEAGKTGVVDATESAGAMFQHRYGCRVDISDNTKGATAPVVKSRSYLPNFDHTINIAFETGEGTPETRGFVRGQTHEVHNATCTVSIDSEKNSDFQKMLVKDETRAIFLGFGPGGDTAGEGGCFAILNAGRDDGATSPTAGDQNRIQQSTVLRALENQALCDETGLTDAEKRLSSAPFMFILPKA